MLAHSGWEGALLSEAVERTLEPHAARVRSGEAERISITRPPVRLASNTVVTLNLAVHELATNAAKYGGLSAPAGRVEVTWTLERTRRRGAPALVEILWQERGGPPVRLPEHRGFGSRLLEQGLAREAGADVRLDFAPEGVECRIRPPLAAAAAGGGQTAA